MEHKIYTMEFAGRPLSFEFGKYAGQALAPRWCWLTALMVSATVSDKPRDGVDFFPLSVDYEEKHYAVGKSPAGSSSARRPTEKISSPAG